MKLTGLRTYRGPKRKQQFGVRFRTIPGQAMPASPEVTKAPRQNSKHRNKNAGRANNNVRVAVVALMARVLRISD